MIIKRARRLHRISAAEAALVVALGYGAAGCGAQTPTSPALGAWVREPDAKLTLAFRPIDSTVARTVRRYATAGMDRAEQAFQVTFRERFELVVYPDRRSMIDRWRQAWNQPSFESKCWMVAAGWAAELSVLSPRLWATDACGHDASDSVHVNLIVAHEMVHVLHAQSNGAYGALQAGAPWLSEGLAVYASGQWSREYAGRARDLARAGNLPESFQAMWATSNGYALAGATVAYITATRGDGVLRSLLSAESWPAVLGIMGVSERDLIAAMRTWLLS
jgi:hypothetical protein